MKLSKKAMLMILECVVENGIGLIDPGLGLCFSLTLLVLHLLFDKEIQPSCQRCSTEIAIAQQLVIQLPQCNDCPEASDTESRETQRRSVAENLKRLRK